MGEPEFSNSPHKGGLRIKTRSPTTATLEIEREDGLRLSFELDAIGVCADEMLDAYHAAERLLRERHSRADLMEVDALDIGRPRYIGPLAANIAMSKKARAKFYGGGETVERGREGSPKRIRREAGIDRQQMALTAIRKVVSRKTWDEQVNPQITEIVKIRREMQLAGDTRFDVELAAWVEVAACYRHVFGDSIVRLLKWATQLWFVGAG